jgi:hypothetical protein
VRRAAALLAAAALSIGLASSCGNGDVAAEDEEATASSLNLPAQVVGLKLVPEQLEEEDLQTIDRPYIDNLAVFSLREGELLRATLQVARFNRAARPEDDGFRGQILGLLGGQRPFDIVVGDTEVNATTGTSENVFAWFGGRGMFILSVQQDYPFPRTLLRRLIERDLEL